MPSYTVARGDIHDKIAEVEGRGEIVVSAQMLGPDWLLITQRTAGYRAEPGSVESR